MYRKMDLTYGIVHSLLLFSLWGLAAGCSDDDASGAGGLSDGRKELVMYASGDYLPGDTSLSAGTVFFAKGNEPGKYRETWKAYIGVNGRTGLAFPKYYPADNSPVYLRGFAPDGTLTDRMTIAYPMDGRQDILVTDEQQGRLTDMFWQQKKSFVFTHLLTQLRFRLCMDEEGVAHGWKLHTLAVDSLPHTAVLSLADKTLSFEGENVRIAAADRSENGLPLDTAWTEIPEAVMVQPGVPLHLSVALKDSRDSRRYYRQLPVVFHEEDGRSLAGTSYLLSVRIRTDGTASLSASVAEWKRGDNGIGTID